mmetsp:Transcript_6673/g.16887  ORF Transcript_6673/g.16887 Transcript_6673/m.16887 type:complete len:254 (-) Transcript_6673:641-1402(-)
MCSDCLGIPHKKRIPTCRPLHQPHDGHPVVTIVEVATMRTTDVRLLLTGLIRGPAPELCKRPAMPSRNGSYALCLELHSRLESDPAELGHIAPRRGFLEQAPGRLPGFAAVRRNFNTGNGAAGPSAVGDAGKLDLGGACPDEPAWLRCQDDRIHGKPLQSSSSCTVFVIVRVPRRGALRAHRDVRHPLHLPSTRDAREHRSRRKAVVWRQGRTVHVRRKQAVVRRIENVAQRCGRRITVEALKRDVQAVQDIF